MEHIWNRMLYLRKKYFINNDSEQPYTQSKMAAIMNVSENTARSYEKIGGTQPKSQELRKLWEYDKKLDIHWIITGEGTPNYGKRLYDIDKPEDELPGKQELWMRIAELEKELREIREEQIEQLKLMNNEKN